MEPKNHNGCCFIDTSRSPTGSRLSMRGRWGHHESHRTSRTAWRATLVVLDEFHFNRVRTESHIWSASEPVRCCAPANHPSLIRKIRGHTHTPHFQSKQGITPGELNFWHCANELRPVQASEGGVL